MYKRPVFTQDTWFQSSIKHIFTNAATLILNFNNICSSKNWKFYRIFLKSYRNNISYRKHYFLQEFTLLVMENFSNHLKYVFCNLTYQSLTSCLKWYLTNTNIEKFHDSYDLSNRSVRNRLHDSGNLAFFCKPVDIWNV